MHFWIALHHPYHFFGEANSSSSSDSDARVVCHLLLTVINFRTRQEAAQLSQISYNARRKAAKITQIDRPRKKKSYEAANIICKKAVDNHVKKMKVICKLHPFFTFENAFCESFQKILFTFTTTSTALGTFFLAAYDRYLSHPYEFLLRTRRQNMTASSSSSFFTKEKLFQTGQVDRKYVSVSSFLLRSFGFKLSLFWLYR